MEVSFFSNFPGRAVIIPLKKIQTTTREEKAILLEPSFDHKHQAMAQRKHYPLRHLAQRSFKH